MFLDKLARVFVPGRSFQPSLIFEGKDRSPPRRSFSRGRGKENSGRANLTRDKHSSLFYWSTNTKSFVTLTIRANVIKLFTAVSYKFLL